MPTSKKIFTVQNLTEKLKQAKSLVLTNYQGLNVSQMAELRQEIKKTGGEFEVVKNSLLNLAIKEGLPKTAIEASLLQGPTAVLWIYEENTTPLKTLDDFIKKTELPKVKLGFWNGEIMSGERLKELTHLPSLQELRAKLVGTLQSPPYRLANALNWNLRKLILVLKAKGGES